MNPTLTALPQQGHGCVGVPRHGATPQRGSLVWLGSGDEWTRRRAALPQQGHGCIGVPRQGATPQRGSPAWPGYTPAGVYEGGPVGVPARRGQEEVSLQFTKAPLQLSTAWLLVMIRPVVAALSCPSVPTNTSTPGVSHRNAEVCSALSCPSVPTSTSIGVHVGDSHLDSDLENIAKSLLGSRLVMVLLYFSAPREVPITN